MDQELVGYLQAMEQRLTERIETLTASVEERLTVRIETLSARIDSVEQRLTVRIETLSARIDSVEQQLTARIDSVEQRLTARIDSVEQRLTALADLVSSVSESLQREMHAGFERINVQMEDIARRLDRHGSLLQTGARWTARMATWSERVDKGDIQRDTRISKLEERILRMGEPRPPAANEGQ